MGSDTKPNEEGQQDMQEEGSGTKAGSSSVEHSEQERSGLRIPSQILQVLQDNWIAWKEADKVERKNVWKKILWEIWLLESDVGLGKEEQHARAGVSKCRFIITWHLLMTIEIHILDACPLLTEGKSKGSSPQSQMDISICHPRNSKSKPEDMDSEHISSQSWIVWYFPLLSARIDRLHKVPIRGGDCWGQGDCHQVEQWWRARGCKGLVSGAPKMLRTPYKPI